MVAAVPLMRNLLFALCFMADPPPISYSEWGYDNSVFSPQPSYNLLPPESSSPNHFAADPPFTDHLASLFSTDIPGVTDPFSLYPDQPVSLIDPGVTDPPLPNQLTSPFAPDIPGVTDPNQPASLFNPEVDGPLPPNQLALLFARGIPGVTDPNQPASLFNPEVTDPLPPNQLALLFAHGIPGVTDPNQPASHFRPGVTDPLPNELALLFAPDIPRVPDQFILHPNQPASHFRPGVTDPLPNEFATLLAPDIPRVQDQFSPHPNQHASHFRPGVTDPLPNEFATLFAPDIPRVPDQFIQHPNQPASHFEPGLTDRPLPDQLALLFPPGVSKQSGPHPNHNASRFRIVTPDVAPAHGKRARNDDEAPQSRTRRRITQSVEADLSRQFNNNVAWTVQESESTVCKIIVDHGYARIIKHIFPSVTYEALLRQVQDGIKTFRARYPDCIKRDIIIDQGGERFLQKQYTAQRGHDVRTILKLFIFQPEAVPRGQARPETFPTFKFHRCPTTEYQRDQNRAIAKELLGLDLLFLNRVEKGITLPFQAKVFNAVVKYFIRNGKAREIWYDHESNALELHRYIAILLLHILRRVACGDERISKVELSLSNYEAYIEKFDRDFEAARNDKRFMQHVADLRKQAMADKIINSPLDYIPTYVQDRLNPFWTSSQKEIYLENKRPRSKSWSYYYSPYTTK
jgi:hypothetical protein